MCLLGMILIVLFCFDIIIIKNRDPDAFWLLAAFALDLCAWCIPGIDVFILLTLVSFRGRGGVGVAFNCAEEV